ncbi:MAG: hypothetical protein KDD37_02945 [Bdellovibrionales bacterium]|nr:hypothetical protein [Bdellovibrionales bacterium]
MFVGLILTFIANSLVFSGDYADFSASNTCNTIDTNIYNTHSLFRKISDTDELIIQYEYKYVGNKLFKFTEPDTYSSNAPLSIFNNLSNYGMSALFLAKYMKVKDYVIDNFGYQFWPKQIRLIYAGDEIAYLPGIGALFCRSHQTQDTMVLKVTTNFLENPDVFGRILAHEVYHYLMHVSKNKIPFWLEEGLALNFEDKAFGSITSSPMMDWHMVKSPWTSLSTLGKSKTLTKQTLYSFYGQASLLIYYIQKNIGADLAKEFLRNSYGDWKEYLEAVIKSKWDSFEDLFIDFQVAKYINRADDYNLTLPLDENRYKYTLLPSQLSDYIVEPNRKKIKFTPEPLSAFIPEDVSYYEGNSDYTIKWVFLSEFSPIIVSDMSTNINSFPVVIRWK